MQTPSFGEYLLEQEFLELLALSAGIAAGYLAFLSTGAAVASLRSRSDGTNAFVLASALTLALFVVCFTLFEAAALYFRYDPRGTGTERHGVDREHFVSLANAGFALLYFVIPLVGAAAGYVVARRLRSARPGRVAAAVSIAIVAFLVLTLPLAEFENACNIGEPIVLQSSC